MSRPDRPSMQHRKSTSVPVISRERMELLTRIYHSTTDASVATGLSTTTLLRAADRYGLRFRLARSLAADPMGDSYLKEDRA